LSASGGTNAGFTWSTDSPALPAWLSLSAGGMLAGTPPGAGGPITFGVKVTDSAGGSATQTFSFTIIAGPSITTTSPLPNAEATAPYSQTLSASGGTNLGFTWSPSPPALPAWLSLSGGVLTGTPPTAGGPF